MIPWQQITHLGGLSFTAPIAFFIAVLMATGGKPRLALYWCALFGAAMLAVMGTKVAFLGWGWGWREAGFAGLSGHAARAAAVFPVAFFLLFQDERRRALGAGVGFGVLCGVVISVSRVMVHAHPASEAGLGFAAGTLVALLFIHRLAREDKVRVRPLLVLLCMAVLLASPRQEPVDSEKWMAVIAMKLSGHDRTYQRWSWKLARSPYRVVCRPGERAHGYRCS